MALFVHSNEIVAVDLIRIEHVPEGHRANLRAPPHRDRPQQDEPSDTRSEDSEELHDAQAREDAAQGNVSGTQRDVSGSDSLCTMCRSIKPLNNFEPPATDDEVRAAALQFVRKVSGGRDPSQVNREVFDAAVVSIAEATRSLVDSLETNAPPKKREEEAAKARARAAKRYAS